MDAQISSHSLRLKLSSKMGDKAGESPIKYNLSVHRADIDLSTLKLRTKNPKMYTEILITGEIFRTHSAPHRNLEWAKRFNISSKGSTRITFHVKKERLICRDPVLGKVEIRVDELLTQCKNGNDCSLKLQARESGVNIGKIIVRLESAHQDAAGARDNLSLLKKDVADAGLGQSAVPGMSSAIETGENVKDLAEQTGALTLLGSLCSRLDQLKPDNLKPFIEAIDEVAKIHPYVNAAWNVASALYKLYEKKVKMENDIVGVIAQMNDILSFVEDMQMLQKIRTFINVVEEVLRVIDECGQSVLKYLNSSVAGRTWKAFAEAEQFNSYKSRFGDLSLKLTRSAAGQAAVGVAILEGQNNQIISTLEELKKNQEEKRHRKTLNLAAPPNPSSIFTGREEYLKKMEEKFEFPKTSVELGKPRKFVLYGPGGVGKTQLVLKFSASNRERFAVQYMVDATSEATLANSFKNIGESNNIPDPDVPKTLRWLCELKEDWVLIYDNADNHDIKYNSFIPDSLHGNILMTTRNPTNRTLAPPGNSIEVSILDTQSAIHLLFQSARLGRTPSNEGTAKKIVEELGCLALGIVQAGSYIATQSEFPDLDEYYSLFQENRSRLLAADLGPEVPYKDPVYATWDISFNALTPMAQFFMQLCSFLYRDGITEEIFRRAATSKKVVIDQNQNNAAIEKASPPSLLDLIQHLRKRNDEWDTFSFRELVKSLRSYSLVQEPSQGIYSIHPLIHSWARDRMKQDEQESMQADAIRLLYFSLPNYKASDVVYLRKLLPHLNFCGHPKDTEMKSVFASVYFTCGKVKDAQVLWDQVLADHREKLGDIDPKTLACMSYLSSTYRQENRLDIAEQLQDEALRGFRRVLGEDHRETLITMGNLALTYQRQGRLAEAEKLQEEALAIRRRLVGESHRDTLIVKSGLSETYLKRGRLSEAETLAHEASTGLEHELGSENRDTLTATGRLALVYYHQGRLAEAEKLQTESLDIRIRLFGAEHRHTLLNMDQLAMVYRDLGRVDEAIKLEVITVEASERVNGLDHPQTLEYKENLASMYAKQSHIEKTDKSLGERQTFQA